MMTEIVKGKTLEEANKLFETFQGLATGISTALSSVVSALN